MKSAAAAKPLSKNNSDGDEERIDKKRTIKSNKRSRRRRLRDSSLSSSSPSASSDYSPRLRRKRAKKPEKRRREPKISDKKNKKKQKKRKSRKSRPRSVSSSSSYSSWSCSTCRGRSSSTGRSVSRSPPPRSRSTGRSGRDGDAERGRSRRRKTASYERCGGRHPSRSCSTCGGSRSSSANRRGADRSRSYSREKYEEIEQPRRLRSVLAMTMEVGNGGRDEQRDRIIQAYDDYNRYDSRRESDSYGDAEERDALQGARMDSGNAWVDNEVVVVNESNKQLLGIADAGANDFARKKSDNSGGSEAADLESQLRQRALENFKMFRRRLSANTRSGGDQEKESSQTLVAEAQEGIKSLDVKFTNSFEHLGHDQGETRPVEPRIRSVVNIPAERKNSNHLINHQHSSRGCRKVNEPGPDNSSGGTNNSSQLKRVEESSNKISLRHTSLIKDKQEKRVAAEPRSSTDCDAADRQPASELAAHHKMEGGNENKEEGAGSQCQQKTFSRMHDGKLVQVSYKVYIPKKTPALACRQLQR